MKVAVAGGSGFIGGHLVRHLLDRGAEVSIISRRDGAGPHGVQSVTWRQLEETPSVMEGTDAIVNLAGESINQRWTPAAKQRIIDSRLEAAERIARLVERLERKPRVVVNGSGMSIYGTSEADTYDETSPARNVDFLSGVVQLWEQTADRIPDVRLVKIRIGLVLGRDGGALPKMVLPYRLGVGGRIGSGRQWNSWIHVTDMARLIAFCIENEEIRGPVNATAPQPVQSDEFGRLVARVLGRPHWLPVPAAAFKLLFGELSDLLLKGQRVLPRVLLEHGFAFRYATLEEALRDLYRRR